MAGWHGRFLSGDVTKTAWANWAVSYVKYCDGGSMTGTRQEPTPARNGSEGPLYYRGHYNIEAQLDSMVATKGLAKSGNFDIILGPSPNDESERGSRRYAPSHAPRAPRAAL